jgi:hypothetical protein
MTGKYTRQALWSLFLMCVFPQHLWTLILAFRDMSWLIERTNIWDAVGNASYALLFAFIESLLVFGLLALLGLVTPKQWEVNRRVAFLTLLLFVTVIWAMVAQLLYLWNVWLPPTLMQFIASTGRPLVMLYLLSLALVVPTVSLPVLVFLRSKKALPALLDLMDRLSTLSMLYLFFDGIGLVVVIIRNIL